MLEFAYTGEVNVAQDLLPSLLQTARAFRIKGLDKVESPVDIPLAHQHHPETQPPRSSSSLEHWAESAPATRSLTPCSSNHSQQPLPQPDVKPFFLSNEMKPRDVEHPPLKSGRRDSSPPHSLPTSSSSSQPPTRDPSPCPVNGSRTPPPKRWKRSFDQTQPNVTSSSSRDEAVGDERPLPMVGLRSPSPWQ
jgi:hypothetical protein